MVSGLAAAGDQGGTDPAAAGETETPPNRPAGTEGAVAVPAASDRAMRYYRTGNWLWAFNTLWGWLIPALFLFTGFSARLRDLARRVGRKWFFIVAVYMILFLAVSYLIDLPLSYYQQFVRQHAYDLSTQTPGKWFSDSVTGLLVGMIAAVLFAWVPYLLIRKSPRRWWLYTGIAMVPFLFFVFLVQPVWVAPLFNKFGPMKDQALEARILALADRAGIQGSRVFEVNKSVDTKAVNAYVTGFANTKRIVLWDTIIDRLDPEELLFVMGHEMGHYVLNHAIKGIFFGASLILVALFLIHRLADRLIARFRHRFGFDELGDIASVPLVLLLFSLFFFLLTPVVMGFGRHLEHEADRFGLELTRDNHAAATAFVKLQEENLGNPRPGVLFKLWRSTHPPLGERIDFCNGYRPWETGEPLVYGDRFAPGTP